MEIIKSDSLQAITTSEIQSQVDTAKKYPRAISKVVQDVHVLATLDKETAESCFYHLPRKDKEITGYSVRLAEIINSCWGNSRASARIIGNDGKMVTAQGVFHDLETNVAVSVEVQRRITDKYGKTFSDDMQIVTSNAACSIAFRNAVFKGIPSGVFKKAIDSIKDSLVISEPNELQKEVARVIAKFEKLGAKESDILRVLGIETVTQIDNEILLKLKGIGNAIKDGDTTIEEVFGLVPNSRKSKFENVEVNVGENGQTKMM